jgi:hypothetical protein
VYTHTRAYTHACTRSRTGRPPMQAGAAIYALRIPERWKPGAFDLAFHSHQLFHVAVVVAAAIHYKAVLVYLDWRDATACP